MATYCPEDGGDRELFSCPICFEDYDLQDPRRAPKLLLCLHTFCYECTQKLWKDGLLECSMCRMLHEKVRLDDLFDNHVIIQHLQKEREEQDLELARRIDQELRKEYGGSPVIVAESNAMEEQNETVDYSGTIEILDSTDENIETDETDLTAPEENSSREANIEDEEEEEEVHESRVGRNYQDSNYHGTHNQERDHVPSKHRYRSNDIAGQSNRKGTGHYYEMVEELQNIGDNLQYSCPPQKVSNSRSVKAANTQISNYTQKGCFNCGELNHHERDCRYNQQLRCYHCDQYGHKSRMCRELNSY